MKTIAAAALLTFSAIALTASTASAQGWRATHPRRAEVNARLNRQDHRINVERRSGEITAAQAHDLHAEDRGIRAEERFDASNNGGHITRAEDRSLNRQENAVSRQIGR
ncbi:MAG: hypothetical protein JSR25_00870 [Proteobacteria bacterium]|nr:hypothetical protein [Pseudomonadota bacterium]